MIFEQLINSIEEVEEEKGYWFVRTDSGENFNTFVENDFIGIGWNEITLNDLNKSDVGSLKNKIAKVEKLDPFATRDKSRITSTLNKLFIFKNFKKGDFIIIPSENSTQYAFGTIVDDEIFTDSNLSFKCNYYKRRKVKWMEVKNVDSLDPIFYKIKNTRHAISDIKPYQNYIDNVTNNLYLKQGYAHYVLEILTTDDINVDSLLTLIQSLKKLANEINKHFDLNEDVAGTSIRLNLQSPGKIELKLPSGKTLIILATIVGVLSGCAPDNTLLSQNNPKLKEFLEVQTPTIKKIEKSMEDLHVKKEEIKNLK
ncbi:restriction system protein [Pedobacter africanus]|uniref:Uncharacterized protein n=1 Tax=Pedobacter africanus TaxID=151894 RepID=A0ACC6KRR9_9SPHI|nr:hypothetical protein [Pedobacter africanus]MDR6781917.1 hypothetical protein [Pedobacter africanus]